jgi:hypothetical protein
MFVMWCKFEHFSHTNTAHGWLSTRTVTCGAVASSNTRLDERAVCHAGGDGGGGGGGAETAANECDVEDSES